MRRALVVALLLSLALVPIVNASGGVINSVVISGDGGIGEGPIDVNVSLIGVGGASSASVNWNATLADSDGNVIDSDSGNILVEDGVISFVDTVLGNAPLGISNLTVTLSGDVGTPGQNQWVTYTSTIQRLRPLDISLGNPIYNPVNSLGESTGNLTIKDGDYVHVEVPVINSGDVNWNGTLEVSIDSVALPLQSVNISGDTTQILTFTSNQLTEGLSYVNATLQGPADLDPSDDVFSGSFEVGPPPLPEMTLVLDRLIEPEPGSLIEWRLSANNSGEADFSGALVCEHNQEQFFSTNVTIDVNESFNVTVSMVSKPGFVFCTTGDARTSSTVNASDTIVMTSAVFIGAGHSTPSLLGGPWHAGDEIIISLLLRNEGDATGSANLRIEIGGVIQNGPVITLDQGKAGELRHEFTIQSSGDHLVNWSIVTPDGTVESNLSGSILVPVLPSQTVVLEIESVEVDEDGIIVSWVATLDEGRERLVVLRFGSIQDGLKGQAIVEERQLLPGATYGAMNIGFQDGQEIYAELSESGWTIGFGSFTSDESPMPDFSINPQITVNPSTQPKVPSQGSQVTVFFTLANIAGGAVPQGQIIVTDINGQILATETSPKFSSGSIDYSAVVEWPSGDNVKIIVTWHVNDKSSSDEVMINSESMEEEDDGFTIPWGGILAGLALGMVIIFAIRIKNSPAREKKAKVPSENKPKKSKDEKVEVACPACDRRLRVPSTYSGAVRCPECETRFDVEGEEETSTEVPKSTPKAEEDSDKDDLWSSSDNDILACPKCTRKLKVPYEKRPAKARCPACSTVFEARKK